MNNGKRVRLLCSDRCCVNCNEVVPDTESGDDVENSSTGTGTSTGMESTVSSGPSPLDRYKCACS